jgi:hypothetical protein
MLHATVLAVALLGSSALQEGTGPALARIAWSVSPEEHTEVLVLATDHLGQYERFEPAWLDELLGILAEFDPQAICVETLPARAVTAMVAEGATYEAVLAQFVATAGDGGQGDRARERSGLTRRDAQERAIERLAHLDQVHEPAQRAAVHEELAELYLAADDLPSAVLQLAHAGPSPTASGPLPADVRSMLVRQRGSPGEVYSIGVALARRLGLQRLHAVDDHADKDDFLAFAARLVTELGEVPEVQAIGDAPIYQSSRASQEEARARGTLLPHYLFLNSVDYQVQDTKTQWDLFLRTRLPSGLDRSRAALWEVRNLNIASHVRRVTAHLPGGRVLVVIGASHKPFLEAYLGNCMDVRVVQLSDWVE